MSEYQLMESWIPLIQFSLVRHGVWFLDTLCQFEESLVVIKSTKQLICWRKILHV